MAIDSEEFKKFVFKAFNESLTESNTTLHCFKCGEKIEEKNDKSGLTCTNQHNTTYLQYMTDYSNMLKGFFDNFFSYQDLEKITKLDEDIIYIGLEIVFVNDEIVRIK